MEGVQRFSRLGLGVQSAASDPKQKIKGRSLARHDVTFVPGYVNGRQRSVDRCPTLTPASALFAFLAGARRSSCSLELFETLLYACPSSSPQRYAAQRLCRSGQRCRQSTVGPRRPLCACAVRCAGLRGRAASLPRARTRNLNGREKLVSG